MQGAVTAMADAIRRRHGGAVAALLFYGSCLRRGGVEGVLDFYVIVDSYGAAYERRFLALLNRVLPPNVFYVECDHAGARLRAKYAVFSQRDFDARGGGRTGCARVVALLSTGAHRCGRATPHRTSASLRRCCAPRKPP